MRVSGGLPAMRSITKVALIVRNNYEKSRCRSARPTNRSVTLTVTRPGRPIASIIPFIKNRLLCT